MNSAMLDGERKEERELTVGCYVYTYTFVKLRWADLWLLALNWLAIWRQIPLNLSSTPSPGSTLARRFAVYSRPTSGAPCTEFQNLACTNGNDIQVSAFLATGVDVYALSTTLSNECSTLPPRGKDDLLLPQSRRSNVHKIFSSRAEIQSLSLAPTSVSKGQILTAAQILWMNLYH